MRSSRPAQRRRSSHAATLRRSAGLPTTSGCAYAETGHGGLCLHLWSSVNVAQRSGRSLTPLVGVFDSGVGGLSVVAALHRYAPALPIRYIADTRYFPYGERSAEEVDARADVLAAQLVAEGCRLLVVACNTASSSSLERLRERYPVPIVGMEPPLKPAVERSRSRRVAVLVTPGTARGERLARLHDQHRGDAEVRTIAMPGLADLVERGEIAGGAVDALLHERLDALPSDGVDVVALGCTHYPFVRRAIEAVLGPDIEVIDAGDGVARRVLQQLTAHGIAYPAGATEASVPVEVSVTGDLATFEATLDRLRAAGADLPSVRLIVAPMPSASTAPTVHGAPA